MANSCCQESYTDCNEIVNIAYLKAFIGNDVQDSSNGSVKGVTTSESDTYCPTYGELVGGSLVQNHKAAADGKWSDDIDGIIVGGSYSNNECVRQGDLSLVYTRFKSLTSTASTTSISECGGDTTMSYTYTLTRTKKEMNANCTVDTTNTDGNDTNSDKVTYTSSNSVFTVSKPLVAVGKNSPTSNCPATASSRNTVISTKVTFRGADKSASPITITQLALGGDYYDWRAGSSSYTSNSYSSWVNFEPSGCQGGPYGRCRNVYRDTYTTTWREYRWTDSCGTNYDKCTTIRDKSGPTRTSHDYLREECVTAGTRPNTCSSCCTASDYDNNAVTFTTTVSCEAQDVYVDIDRVTYITSYTKSDDASCASETCPNTERVVYEGGETVSIPANTSSRVTYRTGTANGRHYRITQRACTECDCNPTYGEGNGSAPASGGSVVVTWNYTYPSSCNSACHSGSVIDNVDIPCNSGASRSVTGIHETYGTWTVSQASGTPATCGAGCDCYSATTPATVTASSYSATSAQVEFYVSKRVGGTWGSPTARTENVTFSANTGSSAVNRTGVITLNDCNSCDGNCEDKLKVNWTVVVPGNSCTCADIEPTGTTAVTIPQSGGTYEFTYSNCVGYVGWTSSSWAVPSRTSRTFTITAAENNTTSARTVSLTFTFYLQEGDTTPCGTYTVEITQAGKFECPEYAFRETPVPSLDYKGGTARFEPYKKNE